MKKLSVAFSLLISALFVITFTVSAQSPTPPATGLQQGDIAIIGFNFTNNDEFTVVALKYIPAGTTIRFTDKGWTNGVPTGGFVSRSGDGIYDYVTPSNLSEGAVIKIVIPTGEAFALDTNGDQIFAYLGPGLTVDKILFGLNSSGPTWVASCTTANNSALPSILDPKFSIAIPHKDGGYYNGPRTFANTDSFYTSLHDLTKWETSDSRLNLPTDSFTFDPTIVQFEKFHETTNLFSLLLPAGLIILLIVFVIIQFKPKKIISL